jgi:hypothetical protein
MGAAVKLSIDSPDAGVMDIISDEQLIEVLRQRGPTVPPNLEVEAVSTKVQLERERRVLRLLPRVSR